MCNKNYRLNCWCVDRGHEKMFLIKKSCVDNMKINIKWDEVRDKINKWYKNIVGFLRLQTNILYYSL